MSHSATFAGQAATIDGERIYVVELRLSATEMDAMIAAYDPQSATSPSAADCRTIARPVLDAILAAQEPT